MNMRTNSLTVSLALASVLMLAGAGCMGSTSSTARTSQPYGGTPTNTIPANPTTTNDARGSGATDTNLVPGAPLNNYEQDISSPSQ